MVKYFLTSRSYPHLAKNRNNEKGVSNPTQKKKEKRNLKGHSNRNRNEGQEQEQEDEEEEQEHKNKKKNIDKNDLCCVGNTIPEECNIVH